MDDLDILTLAEAAERLGVAPSTLRHQVKAGRLHARLLGKTWVTTGAEVERYRQANLGRQGRPQIADVVAQIRWPDNVYKVSHLEVKAFADTPRDDVDGMVESLRAAIEKGAWTMAEVVSPTMTSNASNGIPFQWREDPPQVVLVRLASPGEPPNMLTPRPPFEDVTGRPDEPNILEDRAPGGSGHRKWSEVKRERHERDKR